MRWLEEKLIYFPEPYPGGLYGEAERVAPREGGYAPSIEDCDLVAEDGVRLHAWYCRPQTRQGGEVQPVSTDREA